jgi:integrase
MSVMPRKLPKYVQRHRDASGYVRFYFRRGKGKRAPLPAPSDPGFDAAYAACLADVPRTSQLAHKGTLAWLVARYKESGQFARLAPSTRKMRDQVLQRAVKSAGHVSFDQIRPVHIRQSMERRQPSAANNFRKIMNQLFQWALRMELASANPVAGIESVRTGSGGFHTWTIDEVERFNARWPLGTRERLALCLFPYTGLRISDVAVLGRQHVSEGVISILTRKTKTWVHIPIFAELRAAIDACPANGLAFLETEKGQPFASANSLGNWFRKACEAAGVPGRAHGLRKAGATIAADNGATVHQLMGMYGWRHISQAEVYTREADRRLGARATAERIENAFTPKANADAPKNAKISNKSNR